MIANPIWRALLSSAPSMLSTRIDFFHPMSSLWKMWFCLCKVSLQIASRPPIPWVSSKPCACLQYRWVKSVPAETAHYLLYYSSMVKLDHCETRVGLRKVSRLSFFLYSAQARGTLCNPPVCLRKVNLAISNSSANSMGNTSGFSSSFYSATNVHICSPLRGCIVPRSSSFRTSRDGTLWTP